MADSETGDLIGVHTFSQPKRGRSQLCFQGTCPSHVSPGVLSDPRQGRNPPFARSTGHSDCEPGRSLASWAVRCHSLLAGKPFQVCGAGHAAFPHRAKWKDSVTLNSCLCAHELLRKETCLERLQNGYRTRKLNADAKLFRHGVLSSTGPSDRARTEPLHVDPCDGQRPPVSYAALKRRMKSLR